MTPLVVCIYKEDIFPFHDSSLGTTLTIACQMDDQPGLLSVSFLNDYVLASKTFVRHRDTYYHNKRENAIVTNALMKYRGDYEQFLRII